MNRILIALLVTCALTDAMVPRHRRAIDKDEVNEGNQTEKICAPTTPCGWSFLNPTTKHVEQYVINTYCVCEQGQLCLFADSDVNYDVYLCKPEHSKNIDTTTPVS